MGWAKDNNFESNLHVDDILNSQAGDVPDVHRFPTVPMVIYLCFQIYFPIDHHCKTWSELTELLKNSPNLLNFLQDVAIIFAIFLNSHNFSSNEDKNSNFGMSENAIL